MKLKFGGSSEQYWKRMANSVISAAPEPKVSPYRYIAETLDVAKLINAVRGSEAAQVLFESRIRPKVGALAVRSGAARPVPSPTGLNDRQQRSSVSERFA